MDFENIFQPTLNRLSSLVFRQYGCDFDYQSITELTRDNLTILRQRLRSGLPVTAGDWVFFPVFVGDDLAGAARISSRENMTEEDINYLHQVIRMVLENSLNNIERLDILSQYEDHIATANERENQTEDTNLVYLSNYQKNNFPLPNNVGKESLAFPFMIECKNEEDLYKMALEVHSQSRRFAFLNIEDLSSEAFKNVETLRKLGPITVFVSDLTQLTLEQQNCIVDHYTHMTDLDVPHFVCGTQMPLAQLISEHKVLPGLVKVLAVGHLAMTRPFNFYKSRNILEFFDIHPTDTTTT